MTRALAAGSPAEGSSRGSSREAGRDRSAGETGDGAAFAHALGDAALSADGGDAMAALGVLARTDPDGLGDAIAAAFGARAGDGRGAALVARLATGGVAAPEVQLAGGELLPVGVRGAYAMGGAPGEAPGAGIGASGAVWLERGLSGDTGAAGRVLLEELGHHLDAQLGGGDAPGDEGAAFAALVLGEPLSPGALARLRAEDDRGRLADGTRAEFAAAVPAEEVAAGDPGPDPDVHDPRGRDQVPDGPPTAPPPPPDPDPGPPPDPPDGPPDGGLALGDPGPGPDDRLSGGGGEATLVSGPGDDVLGVVCGRGR